MLDGNHLRIPNSTVCKAVILNYTPNPQRRSEFDPGVDADDDPVAAMGAGALCGLKFVPRSPEPSAQIVEVGVSNIVLRFMGWIDRSDTDFAKARPWRSARSRSAGKRRVRTARTDLPAADRSARRRAAWSSAGPGRTPDHTFDLTGSPAAETSPRHRTKPVAP
ncbi:MAG TPA: mechanosensitive ion channel family protein [Croceicoccus sp.]|nr:mechanosensitive ion channel family protein [Croceicoccus sp.]